MNPCLSSEEGEGEDTPLFGVVGSVGSIIRGRFGSSPESCGTCGKFETLKTGPRSKTTRELEKEKWDRSYTVRERDISAFADSDFLSLFLS